MEKSQSSFCSLSYWDRHSSNSPCCTYEQHILTNCSKCNAFQAISDLVHEFMNFNTLKILSKTYKKIKTDPSLILTQGNLLVTWYIYAQ